MGRDSDLTLHWCGNIWVESSSHYETHPCNIQILKIVKTEIFSTLFYTCIYIFLIFAQNIACEYT